MSWPVSSSRDLLRFTYSVPELPLPTEQKVKEAWRLIENFLSDTTQAMELLKKAIVNCSEDKEIIAEAKLIIVEFFFRMREPLTLENQTVALNLINEIIEDKTLQESRLARAYLYKVFLFKIQYKSEKELLRAYFGAYLFGNSEIKKAIEAELNMSTPIPIRDTSKALKNWEPYDPFLIVQTYHHVVEELREHLKTPPQLWIQPLGYLTDFLETHLKINDSHQLNTLKSIIFYLVEHDYSLRPVVCMEGKIDFYNALGKLCLDEARKHQQNNVQLALKLLKNVSEYSTSYKEALKMLVQLICKITFEEIRKGKVKPLNQAKKAVKNAKIHLLPKIMSKNPHLRNKNRLILYAAWKKEKISLGLDG